MHCANPECSRAANDLTIGLLRLIELEVSPEQRVARSDGGFPICVAPSRYFWLCEKCCEVLSIRNWTSDGLVFESRKRLPSMKKTVQQIDLPMARAARGPQLVVGRTA